MSASGNALAVSKPWQFQPGHDPRRGLNGGRPRKLAEIEEMLDSEHRTVANVKETMAQLYVLATEPVISRWVDEKGNEHESIRQPNPAFMKMYLDRVLGPVSEDTSDKIKRLAHELLTGMLAEARQRRAAGGG